MEYTIEQFMLVLKTVLANRDHKINGIKGIRAALDTGLLEAKKLYEVISEIMPPSTTGAQYTVAAQEQTIKDLQGRLAREEGKVEVLKSLVQSAMGRY